MNFTDAIKVCFSKYVDFNGRASRSEYWWFFLFCFLCSIVLGVVSETLSTIFSLATLLPTFAVGARRLHDINKSGWLQLIWILGYTAGVILAIFGIIAAFASGRSSTAILMVIVGGLVFLASLACWIYFNVKPSDVDTNQYGSPML